MAAAVRARLRPLGLRQRGRSRLWLDDHGWWLGLVEFPSPRWSEGGGPHVGAMWLWQDLDHFAFNVSERLRGTADYRDDEQFAPVAEDLALLARGRMEEFRRRFPDPGSAAELMAAQPVRRGHLREPWNAGVAAALVGDTAVARERFAAVLEEDPIAPWMRGVQRTAREVLGMVRDSGAVRSWVVDRVASCRQRLSLVSSRPFEDVFDGQPGRHRSEDQRS
ncbi:hypothetical protein KIK06_06520 [Nocardiopsis sp. EMB25]|nr:hypothetical protein [Nocardiopsis sp. EMB25]MCY9783546.1 hypothetical protein [Nocardiopsis sp. EMB25]